MTAPDDLAALALRDCGPCDHGGARVRDVLPDYLPDDVRAVVLARLDAGEAQYGAPLRVGWAPAADEAVQEGADLVAYLVAGGAPAGLTLDAVRLTEGVLRWRAGR